MEDVEAIFQKAIDSGSIPGAVLLARDVGGRVNYSKSLGYRSVRGNGQERPLMTTGTVMRLASASKFLTSIMALQCVELGLVDLGSEAVSKYLPELASMKVITGFDANGEPTYRDRAGDITLKHLLSHSSGLFYARLIPVLNKYLAWRGLPVEGNGGADTMEENYLYPLAYDPGTSWGYGPSLDWAGRLIERASGTTLETFMQKHLCEPLGIRDMTFKLQERPDMVARLADMSVRDNQTGGLVYEDLRYFHHDPIDCFGGQGIWTSPEEYFKVVSSIACNDGKLLTAATRDLMFKGVLGAESEQALSDECFKYAGLGRPVEPTTRKSHSLGGVLTLQDCDGDKWRRKGNLSWNGLPCIYWMIDPETGLYSLSAFHVKPSSDKVCQGLGRKFEEAMFARMKSS